LRDFSADSRVFHVNHQLFCACRKHENCSARVTVSMPNKNSEQKSLHPALISRFFNNGYRNFSNFDNLVKSRISVAKEKAPNSRRANFE